MDDENKPVVLEAAIDACRVFDPPLGVYIVDNDGTILEANREFEKLLGPEVKGHNMQEFYVDASYRDELNRRLEEQEKRGEPFLKAVTLHLRSLGGRELFAKDFSRILYSEDGNWAGMQCCLLDITEEETARRLFESLPAGIYQTDNQDRLIFGNDQLAKIHGKNSFSEIEGRTTRSFFFADEKAAEFKRTLLEAGEVENSKQELVKANGQPFWASVSATALRNQAGEYTGREGVIIDVTQEEQYRLLIEELPIGLYKVVLDRDGVEILDDCNPAFASIFGHKSKDKLVGQKVASLHETDEEYHSFVKALQDAESDHIVRKPISIKTQNGEPRKVEVTARVVRDDNGTITVRYGALQDVTEQEEIRAWEKLIREDFGNFLHTLTSNLMSLTHAFQLGREEFGEDPFLSLKHKDESSSISVGPSSATLDLNLETLDEKAYSLIDSLDKFLLARDDSHASKALTENAWEDLMGSRSLLFAITQEKRGDRQSILRDIARKIFLILQERIPGHIRREEEKQVRSQARELVRLGTLLTLHLAEARLLELDGEIHRLREVVIQSRDMPSVRSILPFGEIVRTAIRDHAEYARRQRVTLDADLDQSTSQTLVLADTSVVRRAVSNLIHNAIKYSWHKPEGSYVTLELVKRDQLVGLRLQNFGVPIAADELEKVFKIGFRGRFSGDRRRRGTGLGLWDSKRIAEDHGGMIDLESVSASGAEGDYSRPHLTTVTFLIDSEEI